jgi:hypothetical protein
MVDSSMRIVLLGSNRKRIGSMGRVRCRLLKTENARIGALVGKMASLTTGIALPFSQ